MQLSTLSSQTWCTAQKKSHVLKGKNKNLLPVFWQSNKKACKLSGLVPQVFHSGGEVLPAGEKAGVLLMVNNVLMMVDNAPGHPQGLPSAQDDITVAFLPSNSTSLIQPLDQGLIHCFKSHYTRLTFASLINMMDADLHFSLMAFWKSFNTANCVTYIKQGVDAIKPETCWHNLWKECIHDFRGFPGIANKAENIMKMVRQRGGDGFIDFIQEEELTKGQQVLSLENLEKLVRSSSSSESTEEEGNGEQDDKPTWRTFPNPFTHSSM